MRSLELAKNPRPVALSRSRRFFPEIESLRGIAVLVVFLVHATQLTRMPFVPFSGSTSLLVAFVKNGRTGVDIFFVLSGFLLSLPFIAHARGGRPVSVRDYLARRALRILPLYYVAVLAAATLTAARPADLLDAVPHLVFLSSFSSLSVNLPPYSTVWWSVVTEVQFYVLLPVAAALFRPGARRWVGVLGLVAYAVAYTAYVVDGPWMGSIAGEWRLQSSLFCRAPLFASGVLAAVVYDRWGDPLRERLASRAWVRRGGADVLLFAALAAIGYFLQWLVGLGPAVTMSPRYQLRDVVNGLGWATVLLILVVAPLWTKSLFSNRILGRIGVISYSMFLLHYPFLYFGLRAIRSVWPQAAWGWGLETWAIVALLGVAGVALCEVSYRYIERPFLTYKARFDSSARTGERSAAHDGLAPERATIRSASAS